MNSKTVTNERAVYTIAGLRASSFSNVTVLTCPRCGSFEAIRKLEGDLYECTNCCATEHDGVKNNVTPGQGVSP